ncbi:PAS domain S-box-containing protein [Sphingomonas sp. PP-F2F-A104-K0414]|uniref:PAS domain S-box protein n=1 Tax=Sphingomonas sp. PP-F2F-A104-K0414 TaxID=2135661 RepID=UPI0010D820AD|nr:PAS domain S-box protein [Sphingomonas sp. PP-F2F-A104-K0414]TCP96406.1 PAS domain S-box-containing protein [Sphingomonas sp. PP-F2F-A104-K0414]
MRLAALERYEVMDTPREASFDDLAGLTAKLFEAPIAVINLIGEGRQFFKAEVGLGVRSTPLESSFCAKALLEDDSLLISDLTLDGRFECNPLVTGDPHIRSYAGALLKTGDGLPIGTLCVLDHRPREWTALHQETLRVLAHQVMAQLDLRLTMRDRDRRYDEVRESEDRFRNMADHAPVMMWVTDPQGNCTYLNRQWYVFTGQTPEEAGGLGWLDATHPDDMTEAGRIFLEANAAQTSFRLEYRLRCADGSYRWAIDAASPRFGQDGQFLGYIGSVIDIHERRAAEDAVRHSSALLAAVMEAVPGVVYAKDRAGRMLAANRGTAELVGKPLSAIIGRTDREFLDDPSQGAAVEVNDRRIMAENDVEVLEEEISLPDGTCATWLSTKAPFRDADGIVVGLVGSSIDISERKRAENALLQLNETLEDAVVERTAERDRMWETSPDLMLVIDFEGVFRRVNPAWTALLGYEATALVGHHVNEFVLEEDHSRTLEALRLTADGQRPDVEVRYRHKDGSVRWISWVAAPAGDMTYATGRDVTAVKEQAEALAQAEEQLRQAQKMEAVGQLTGGLAHDFNNLLTAVTGGLELLGAKLAKGEYDKVDRYINMAQTGANRAAALTQRLLAFSRRQTLAPKPTDVDRLIAEMAEIIDRTSGPAIEVEVASANGLWPILVDAPQLENALLNLCINARDAMPEGGRLTIETGNKALDARAAAAQDLPPGDYVSLCVTDTGTGMEPEIIERVFDPFFTTKPIGEGTGLGLSMIYGFVRQSGGQVRIYSEVGQGTTMCLYLPRLIGVHGVHEPSQSTETRHRAQQGQTVLLVEDEIAIRELVSEILGDAGYRVLTASNGPMGVSILRSNERIDLLVTDVGLPGGLNGRQVADAGRAARPELKILFVTGYAANAAVGAGHLDEGMEILTKPFNMIELERRVGELISR